MGAFSHRLNANLLFNPAVPSSGNVITADKFGINAVFKMQGGFQKQDEPSWYLHNFKASRAVRSLSGGAKVHANLEMDYTIQRSGGLFWGVGAQPLGSPTESIQAYCWRCRSYVELDGVFEIKWNPSQDNIPCGEVEFYTSWWTVGLYDNDGKYVEEYREARKLTVTINNDGEPEYNNSDILQKPKGWTPEQDGFERINGDGPSGSEGDYQQDNSTYWKETGQDITASMIDVGEVADDGEFGGLVRDAQADPQFSFDNQGPKNAWNPERGSGSPFNIDKRTATGKIVMDIFNPCPNDTCGLAGKTYNFTVTYEDYTCRAGEQRTSNVYEDYEYQSSGSGQETFSYTIASGQESGLVEVGTFTWDMPAGKARKLTDLKLTSITNA